MPIHEFQTQRGSVGVVGRCAAGILLAAACWAGEARAEDPANQPAAGADAPIEAVAADKAPAGKDLMPLVERQALNSITSNKKPEHTVEFHLEADGPDLWRLTMVKSHVTFFQSTEGGGVAIPCEDDLGEKVEMTYTPALQMLPGHWPENLTIESEGKVVIKDIKSGNGREKGTFTCKVELIGKQHISTPAGEFDAFLIRETRHMRLQLAKVNVVGETWYVAGKGDVAEHTREKSKVMGLFGGDAVIEDGRLVR